MTEHGVFKGSPSAPRRTRRPRRSCSDGPRAAVSEGCIDPGEVTGEGKGYPYNQQAAVPPRGEGGGRMHVLYATDGSEGALAAAGVLDRLALTSADHITIVTAGDAGEGQPGGPALERARAALQRSPAQIHAEIQQGRAAEVMLRRAEE